MKLPTFNRRSAALLYGGLVAVWVVYIVLLMLVQDGDGIRYHMSLTTANIIRMSFALPILIVWLVSARAALRFRAYANLVVDSPEGGGFRRVSTGLFWLLAYLVLVLLLGRVAPLFKGTDLLTIAVFLKNHLPVYALAVSFIYLFIGSNRLLEVAKMSLPGRRSAIAWLAYFIFTAVFVAIFFARPGGTTALAGDIPAFAVSHSVLLFSLVLPSLLAWALGLMASLNLAYYRSAVKGIIYRAALVNLVNGVYASAVFAILMELLILNSSWLTHLGLVTVLIVLYVLIMAYAMGAVLIYRGAKRLSFIEVVA